MNQEQARTEALTLMAKHGLVGWSLAFNNRKSTMGLCSYTKKRITLSRLHIEHDSDEAVRNTILHEIAHALCSKADGHGPVWKAMARKIGARPERCGESQLAHAIKHRWIGHCTKCGPVYKRHRLARHLRHDSICHRCGTPITWNNS